MTLQQKVVDVLAKAPTPLDALDESRRILREACAPGGPADPMGPGGADGHSAYMAVANSLERSGFLAASQSLLIEWWNDFGNRQRAERKRIYRAVIAFKLTELNMRAGDLGSALRWALHTQADDILGDHPERGGAGKQQLRTIFGMTEPALEWLNAAADECRNAAAAVADWSQPEAFAEEPVRRFETSEHSMAFLFADPSLATEFPLSAPYFASLLDDLDAHQDPVSKGRSLEELASYLILLLPGCVPVRNLLEEDLAFESDMVVSNLARAANVQADLLGRHFLVECKNWEGTLGVKEVGYFLYRMRLTHATFGIIFAKNGITGERDRTAARSLIRRAFHEDGSTAVVLDSVDLRRLASGERTFWQLVLGKLEGLRFGR